MCTPMEIYPTSALHTPDNRVHKFVGYQSVQSVLEHINVETYYSMEPFRMPLNPAVDELTPEDFKRLVENREDDVTWVVDFFAPWCGPCQQWCPPCQRLISEYRQLHSIIDQNDEVVSKIKLGLVDCVKHKSVCEKAGVQSYPTSALHTPDNRVHKFVGYQSVQSVLEHINNALNPAVDELTPEDFKRLVENREDDVTWVLAPELHRAARRLRKYDERVHIGSVDCQAYSTFCTQQSVSSYPSIRLYPALGKRKRLQQFYDYPQNMWRNSDTIERWVFVMLPSLVTSLGNDYWHKVLDSDEPWLVDFFAPWCGHCVQFAPVFEQIAKALEGKVKLGKVDCDQWPGVCRGAQVQAYPTIRFYKGQHDGRQQNVRGLQLQVHSKDEIIRLVQEQLEILSGHDEL
ncbi:thioredoxin [Cooperia oncophora]